MGGCLTSLSASSLHFKITFAILQGQKYFYWMLLENTRNPNRVYGAPGPQVTCRFSAPQIQGYAQPTVFPAYHFVENLLFVYSSRGCCLLTGWHSLGMGSDLHRSVFWAAGRVGATGKSRRMSWCTKLLLHYRVVWSHWRLTVLLDSINKKSIRNHFSDKFPGPLSWISQVVDKYKRSIAAFVTALTSTYVQFSSLPQF